MGVKANLIIFGKGGRREGQNKFEKSRGQGNFFSITSSNSIVLVWWG